MRKFMVELETGEQVEVEALDSTSARKAVEKAYDDVVTAVVELLEDDDDLDDEDAKEAGEDSN